MKEGQDKIYYLTAETLAAAKASPHLEALRKKGVEVILLADRVDEWLVGNLFEFEGKKLASVAKGQVDLAAIKSPEGEDAAAEAPKAEEAQPLLDRIKAALTERAKDVRASNRLVESPACLVADEGDLNGNLARMLKSMGQEVPESKPILEVNLSHALIKRLEVEEGGRFDELAGLLMDQAVLLDGGQLADPAGFVKRMNGLLFG
jgi:molecular chaperone HtpG